MGNDPLKRQRHLDDYRVKEGIKLDLEKMEKNPGLCTLAKMMLNSMWSKFGQRTNKTQVQEFDDPQEFSTFCNSNTLQIKYAGIQSDDRVEEQYTSGRRIHLAYSWPVSRPVGLVLNSTMLSTSYKSEYCTKTWTQSCSIPPRECPSHHWEIIWET